MKKIIVIIFILLTFSGCKKDASKQEIQEVLETKNEVNDSYSKRLHTKSQQNY